MGASELLAYLAVVGLRVSADGDELTIEPASLLTHDDRAALRAVKSEVLELLKCERRLPLDVVAHTPALLDASCKVHGSQTDGDAADETLVDELHDEAMRWNQSLTFGPVTPAIAMPDDSGCRPCGHRLPRGTCGRPVEAGLADHGFGIFWAPMGHGEHCRAFVPRTTAGKA